MAARIENGIYVDIRRSDGRVHNAIVTGFNKETSFVSVEWFEDGETKGKEIALKILYDTNPTLRGTPEHDTTITVVPSKIATNGVLPRPQLKGVSNLPVRQPVDRKSFHQAPQPVPTPAPEPEKSNLKPKNARGVAAVQPVTQPEVDEVEHTIVTTKRNRQSLPARQHVPDIRTKASTPTNGRKSSLPSYQDKIGQARAERRANHEEQKKMREHQMNIDPGNKNWQFLSMIREYQNKVDFKTLSISDLTSIDGRIIVCVRKRPMNKSEITGQEVEVVTIPNKDHIVIHRPDVKYDLTKSIDNQTFRFDCVFDENIDNDMVYRFTAKPLVNTLFDGGHATVFAYGQTGSGKTHTMGGEFRGKEQDASNGLYAFTAADVFRLLRSRQYKNMNLKVNCSFFELYGDRTFDLLAKGEKKYLRVLEDGKGKVNVVGLEEVPVEDESDVIKLIRSGSKNRFAGKTSANACSSRSHAIFQIILRTRDKKVHGKFSIVDLAGSERGADTTTSDAKTRLEGAAINTSLLALKECIRAMNAKQDRAPFRQSKLTLVLRDSFVHEKSRTCMIAMISPGLGSCEHTLNTLHYANRVKELGVEDGNITTKPMDAGEFLTLNNENDQECSQHTIETDINANEGIVLDKTLDLVDALAVYKNKFLELADMANQADYDMLEFATKMKKNLVGMKKEMYQMVDQMIEQVTDFESELIAERELLKR
uniref:Kinesin-like protein n=1 Tax=Steinernema glaseri TaxID=37863 RepID=A0A1I7YCH0_9BILA